MARGFLSCAAGLLCCVSLVMASDIQTGASAARLTAGQIIDKNVAARGGLSAWRSLKAVEMKGKLDAGGNNRPTIPVPGVKKGAQMP
ncbi:MAG TPA: hypothetical protein VJQ54_18920, partial [Candidatus Sulfotelmatobacter sp.]|nr:hypothetical protein [Candidatus Sulfotelmatobacter sp.]